MRITQRAQVIIDLINKYGYKKIGEIGVCKGETAIPVMENCDLDSYVLVDPALNNQYGIYDFCSRHPEAKLYEMTSKEAAVYFYSNTNKFDLIFIDGLHDEESVDRDIHLWTPKVRKGGIICGHDYQNRRFPGVKKAVDRYYDEMNVETAPVRACKMWIVRR